jgi:hypothetical protein
MDGLLPGYPVSTCTPIRHARYALPRRYVIHRRGARHLKSTGRVLVNQGEHSMFICAAGDIHGAMDRLYDDVFAFGALLGIRFDYVLHVGDFGIWPDANRIDKATP